MSSTLSSTQSSSSLSGVPKWNSARIWKDFQFFAFSFWFCKIIVDTSVCLLCVSANAWYPRMSSIYVWLSLFDSRICPLFPCQSCTRVHVKASMREIRLSYVTHFSSFSADLSVSNWSCFIPPLAISVVQLGRSFGCQTLVCIDTLTANWNLNPIWSIFPQLQPNSLATGHHMHTIHNCCTWHCAVDRLTMCVDNCALTTAPRR
jgi:hypothetical protein